MYFAIFNNVYGICEAEKDVSGNVGDCDNINQVRTTL